MFFNLLKIMRNDFSNKKVYIIKVKTAFLLSRRYTTVFLNEIRMWDQHDGILQWRDNTGTISDTMAVNITIFIE